jgi:hypothetical protein
VVDEAAVEAAEGEVEVEVDAVADSSLQPARHSSPVTPLQEEEPPTMQVLLLPVPEPPGEEEGQ